MSDMKRNILPLALRHKRFFLLGILALGVSSILHIITTNFIRIITNNLADGTDINFLPFIIAVPIAVGLAFFMNYISSTLSAAFSLNTIRDVKNQLVSKLMTVRFRYFDEQGSGKVVTRFTADITALQGLLGDTLPGLALQIVSFTAIFIYLLTISPQLLLVSIVAFPLTMVITYFLSNIYNATLKHLLNTHDDFADIVKDVIEGVPIERSCNLRKVISKRTESEINRLLKSDLRHQKITALFVSIRNFIGTLPNLVCCFAGLWLTINGQITVGDLVAFLLLFRNFSESMQSIPWSITDIRQNLVSVRRISEILNEPSEAGGVLTSGADSNTAVLFNSVSFGYDLEKPVLKNVSFSIKTGSSAAVVGSSGGGKTTIFKLLCGSYSPDAGEYRLFGTAFAEWSLEAARKNIAVVSQDDFLFPESIEENLRYGCHDASDEQLFEACRNAGIHDFITSLPQGYNTQIGERGIKLSGGERQRVSIARAFLKNAPILILDEPTSALDAASEAIVQKSLERLGKGKTIITIAHRLSTIQNAGTILVLDGGKICESGTHTELMSHGAVYKALYAKQSDAEAREDAGVVENGR